MSTERWFEKEIQELLDLMTRVSERNELEQLLEAITTPREINDMARRYAAMKLLDSGASYSEIRQILGLNPNTIARISGHVGYGFRRSYMSVKMRTASKRKAHRKPAIRYKGVVPLHRMFD